LDGPTIGWNISLFLCPPNYLSDPILPCPTVSFPQTTSRTHSYTWGHSAFGLFVVRVEIATLQTPDTDRVSQRYWDVAGPNRAVRG
ncbi:hypothetical protein C0995_011110, partial [Termitomyces sp. Mi166